MCKAGSCGKQFVNVCTALALQDDACARCTSVSATKPVIFIVRLKKKLLANLHTYSFSYSSFSCSSAKQVNVTFCNSEIIFEQYFFFLTLQLLFFADDINLLGESVIM